MVRGEHAEAIERLEEGIVLAAASQRTAFVEAHCRGMLAILLLDLGDLERAAEHTERAVWLSKEHGLAGTVEGLPTVVAASTVANRRGDDDRARLLADQAYELMSLADVAPVYAALLSIRLGDLERMLGRRGRALQLVADAERHLRRVPDAAMLPEWLARLRAELDRDPPWLDQLTPAERRVLAQLATHRTLAEIGKALYVSRTTVKSHVSSIYSKLGVSTRAEAVACLPTPTTTPIPGA